MSPKSFRSMGLILAAVTILAGCEMNTAGGALGGGGFGSASGASGGGTAAVGVPVALNTSGQDSCGAIDYKFLEGQPFAHTFDIRLPANSRILGRRQNADATDAGRLTMVVSTSSASMAPFSTNAKIQRVYCG